MNTFRKMMTLSALVGTVLCFSTVAFAQDAAAPQPGAPGGRQRGQGGGRQGGRQMSVAALPVATLDSIVKLTAEQKTKITKIHDEYVKQSEALRPQQGQQPAPDAMQKRRDLNTQTTKQIEDVLTAEQKTKLTDARKEMTLYRMAGIPTGLYGQIKLTAEQKTKLQEIQKSMTPQQGGDREAMRAAQREGREKAAAVLTPAQKAQIEKYQKEHPQERGGQGGGRGQGRGGSNPAPPKA